MLALINGHTEVVDLLRKTHGFTAFTRSAELEDQSSQEPAKPVHHMTMSDDFCRDL